MNEVAVAHQAYREAGWWRDQIFLDDLRRHAGQRPGKAALIGHTVATGQTDTVDYAELARLTRRVARGLVDLGVRPGDYVAVMLPDYWHMLPIALGCVQAGAQVVPLSPEFRRADLDFAFRLTGAKVFIAATDVFGFRPAEQALDLAKDGGLPETVVLLGDDRPPGTLSFAEAFLAGHAEPDDAGLDGRALGPDDPFLLMFTSGTTGTTKAVIHSQNTLYASIRAYAGAFGFDETLVTTTAHSNMYYVGLVVRLLCSLFLGGTAVCLDTWNPRASLDLMARHDVTTFYGSPHFVRELLAAARTHPVRLASLTSVVSGSAPVAPQLWEQVKEVLGVRMYALWGMTENGAATCTRPDDPEDWPAHSDGRPAGGMETRVDPLPGQNGVGHLRVRGPNQCLGYYKQEDIYAAELDADGWFSTGDLARDDGRGGIRITGRAKDIIIHRSSNLPVAEIEAVLGNHPKVADVALIGIPDPDTDERVLAVVTAKGGTAPTLAELRDYLREAGVNDWCWPERLEVIDAMPRNAMGKIRKVDLRARYRS